MPYEYELVVDGVIRRRTHNAYNVGIIKVMSKDLSLLKSNQSTFELRVRKVESYRDLKPVIDFTDVLK